MSNTESRPSIAEAVTARLEAARALVVCGLARETGLDEDTVALALCRFTRERALFYCGADGSPNGHTHVSFRGTVYPRR